MTSKFKGNEQWKHYSLNTNRRRFIKVSCLKVEFVLNLTREWVKCDKLNVTSSTKQEARSHNIQL